YVSAERREDFEAHLRVCDSCARYDRVIGSGVQVFRSLPPLAPSPDFQVRLQGRLYALEQASGKHGSGASLAVTLMICAALGIGAWIPALRPAPADPVRLPPILAHAPYHDLTPVLMRSPTPAVVLPQLPATGYYSRSLLFREAMGPTTTLAYRPASLYGH